MRAVWFLRMILLVLLLTPAWASAKKLSASEGMKEFIFKSKAEGASYLGLIDHYDPGKFLDREEWMRFLKKIPKNEQIASDKTYPELCYKIGKQFQQYQQYKEAYYFFYTTLREEPNVYFSRRTYLADFHLLLGQTYYYFRRYDLAEKHLNISLRHPALTDVCKIRVYNTLGLICRDMQKYGKAKVYMQKGYNEAVRIQHESWIGILSGNLGYLLLVEKEYSKARELIQFDYEISKQKKEGGSQISALRYLIQLDIIDNDLEGARIKLEEFEKLLVGRQQPEFLTGFYDSQTMYFERMGSYQEAFNSYKKYITQKEVIDRKKHALNMENAEFQINFEKKQAEIQVFQQKKQTDNLIIFGLVAFCLLLGLASVIIIRQLQSKRRKDKEILELKTLRMEEELNSTEREMRVVLNTLADKNKLIFELKQEIETTQSANSEKMDQEKENMVSNLQSFSLLTENDWVEFKRLFERLNKGFFDHFNEKYPEVTTSEIRLAALIKLNMSNYEMARTLGISPDSVRKTNLRLRKKLHIDQQDELTRFIKAIA